MQLEWKTQANLSHQRSARKTGAREYAVVSAAPTVSNGEDSWLSELTALAFDAVAARPSMDSKSSRAGMLRILAVAGVAAVAVYPLWRAYRSRRRRRAARFRPCIDLHGGKVKQIVGSTLSDDPARGPTTNFESEKPSAAFAELYARDKLPGGHVIIREWIE